MLREKLKVRVQLVAAAVLMTSAAAFAQPQPPMPQGPPPQMIGPGQLDQLVGRIALYPDPLLAQIMTASTFWNDVPAAAGWANQHSFLNGDALARAIREDNLPWDPSLLALLPFPTVLNMMSSDPRWTETLGNAVLGQRNEVMDAVQRMRAQAANYGYLRSGPQYRVVNTPGDIEILPVEPGYLVVPTYNPLIVFAPPRPGFFVGGAIGFGGPRIFIGGGFSAFGWGGARLGWRDHSIFIDNRVWGRTYVNRGAYVHPYARPYVRPAEPFREHHEIRREERRER